MWGLGQIKKVSLFIIVFLFLFCVPVTAKLFAPDPCSGQTSVTVVENNKYIYENDCFYAELRKNFNDNFVFEDKYNNDFFDLKVYGLREINTANPSDTKTLSFHDIQWAVSYGDDYLEYYTESNSFAESITVRYTIDKNRVKAGMTIVNWVASYTEAELQLRTRVHKEDTASSHFIYTNPVVDGVEYESVTTTETIDNNDYVYETLYTGSSFSLLESDPVYQVDYSPTPGLHLIDGYYTYPNSAYSSVIDITSGLSDNSSSTKYTTYKDNMTYSDNIVMAYKFDETSGNTVADYEFLTPVNISLYGTPVLNVGGIDGSAIDFDGTDDYGIRNTTLSLTTNESFIVCFSILDEGTSSTSHIIDNKGGGSTTGYEFSLNPSDTISFFMRRGSTQTTLTSSTKVDDSQWHTVCGVSLGSGALSLWIDGFVEDSTTGITGSVSTSVATYFGQTDTGGSRFSQKLDEVCSWKPAGTSHTAIISQYNASYCGHPDGTSINTKFSVVYDPNYNWFLRIYKETAGDADVTVYAYDDSDTLSAEYNISQTTGVGYQNLPVDGLMEYMLNDSLLNYSSFRFFSDNTQEFSEVYLRQEANDTQPPDIDNCQVADTTLDCGETTLVSCEITDDIDVANNVTYTIGGTNYSTTKNDSLYYFTYSPSQFGTNTWAAVYAYDILGNLNTTNPNINITYNCIVDDVTATPLDASKEPVFGGFITDNLEEIEYLELNFSVLSGADIDAVKLNYTADGFSACALGNEQSDTCYSYDTPSTRWIEFINNTKTATFDARQEITGDAILTSINSGVLRFEIDEHYNPNIFKHYDALYNFSNIKYQNASSTKLDSYQDVIKVELNPNNIPLNADQYKLDFRVQHNNPTEPLQAFLCNSSYTTGHPLNATSCELVAEKLPSELSGTKFRGVFTKNLVDTLGDIKYALITHNAVPSEYYAIKTLKAIASNYTQYWEYSNDGGSSWTNLGDGYETELNLNWFYNGAEPTSFVYSLWVNDSATGLANSFNGNVTWSVDATNNYPPSANILDPITLASINIPHNITFLSFDPNDDTLSVSLYLYKNDIYNKTIVSGLTSSDTVYLWNDTSVASGTYDIIIEACETATTEQYCYNFTAADINISSFGCVEDWAAYYDACLTNDTQLKYYLDLNDCGTYGSLPVDNGTYVYCDYCTEDLQKSYTSGCYLYGGSGVIDFDWTDANYTSCCVLTGLLSDCSILYSPYNQSSNESCVLTQEDFDLYLDEEVLFGFGVGGLSSDKASGKIYINDTNNTYYCLSYVKTDTGNLVQTNPPYTKRTTSTISLISKEIEDREFFVTSNGLANVYWTNNNLVVDGRSYIFGVECSGNNQRLISEKVAKVYYENINSPINRLFWLQNNVVGVILLFLAVVVIAIVLGFVVYKARGR